jgi:hypothetical protein
MDYFDNEDDDPEKIIKRSERKRVESDAMDRCQYIHPQSHSQCKMKALEGKQKCQQHDIIGKNERKSRYQFARHASSIDEFMKDADFTSMNAEISALRKLFEVCWNRCSDDQDLFMNSSKLESLAEKIQRILYNSKKLEVTLGQMVDKNGFNQFTNEVILIISEEIQDKFLLERIGKRIGESVERAVAKSAQEAEERFGA